MMLWLAEIGQEAGAGGRSGIPVRGPGFIDGAFFLTFLFVHCGSLVRTLVLSSEVECPVSCLDLVISTSQNIT